MSSRRGFLKQVSLLSLGAMMLPETTFAAGKGKKAKKSAKGKMLGLQTYSLGPELQGDKVAQGLVRLREMGYGCIELAGYNNGKISGIPMAEYKKMADDAGIIIKSSHMNPNVLGRGEKYSRENMGKLRDFWKRATDDHAILGLPYMVQPGLPNISCLEDAQMAAEVFNIAGEETKKAGIRFGYHNHDREFGKVVAGGKGIDMNRNARDGRRIEEVFITETDPDKVLIELDVYWTVMGGQDPVEWINKYADRIQLLHIKDRLVLGQSGMMNFEQIFKNFYANGHETFFVEIEDTRSGKQFERVQASAEYLLGSKFV
ncbi:MAG: sugar phosphate isomerase/epimerase [Bacteroidaceae bacterium]|nr:sugar phosphate isomerase/epimerase [Bacteroidaceae bacterium]